MKMGLNSFSMGLLAIIAITALAMSSVAFAAASLSVQVLKYEPSPVEPGKYFDLWLNLENSGLDPANRVTLEILPQYPFSIDSSENATRYFGSIDAADNALVKYKIRAATDALDGLNNLNIRYNVGGGDSWVTSNISILIRTPDAVVSIEGVKTAPEQMAPGKEALVNITLRNMAPSAMKDIILKLDLSSVSIFPIGSATEGKIYYMQPGETGDISFNLLAGPSMDAGAYKIPINLTYSDYAGTSYLKRDYITLIVGDVPEIYVGVDKTEIKQAGTSGKVTFNIINKGLTNIKFLQITLNESSEYEITSPSNNVYIGKLDSDDYQTIEYNVYVKPRNSGILQFPVTLNYRDANNNEFTETRFVEMKLYSNEELANLGMATSGGIPWLIIAVLAVVVYVVYIKFIKKEKK